MRLSDTSIYDFSNFSRGSRTLVPNLESSTLPQDQPLTCLTLNRLQSLILRCKNVSKMQTVLFYFPIFQSWSNIPTRNYHTRSWLVSQPFLHIKNKIGLRPVSSHSQKTQNIHVCCMNVVTYPRKHLGAEAYYVAILM